MSVTQSADRVGQVLNDDSAVQAQHEPADSNPVQVVEQAFTGISAAEIVYESRQQHSSVSEGVASAGHPAHAPVDRMDEFVPAIAHLEAPASAAGGFEGETSGGNDADATGGSNGYGELAETGDAQGATAAAAIASAAALNMPPPSGSFPAAARPSLASPFPLEGSPMDYQATGAAFPGPSPIGKRKSSFEGSDVLEPKRAEGELDRVPSDMAMVTGLSDGEGVDPVEAPHRRMLDATAFATCDSNLGGIVPGLAAAPTIGDGDGDTAEALPALLDAAATVCDGPARGDRPTDAAIIAWENQIRQDEVRDVPLMGSPEPLESLEAEYRAGSDVFLAKIAALRRSYAAIRRARGDGNCFFRSFVFAYLESILQGGDLAERDRAVARLLWLKQRLMEEGVEEFVIETPLELLLGMLRSIGSPSDPLTLAALEGNMRADDVSNYVVFLLRMLTSAEVKHRAEFFAPFVMGLSDMDVDTFCRCCIDPMGEESDHVQMVALTDALQVAVRVIYLDRSTAGIMGGGGGSGGEEGGAAASAAVCGTASTAETFASGAAGGSGGGGAIRADVHDFVPDEQMGGGTEPRVHLLYRPGHYDVLYPQQ